MRLLFDVLHPAHVHFFRALAEHALEQGGEVLFTAREKDVTLQLLEAYDLPHEVISRIHGGKVGLASELLERTARLARRVRRFRPDLMLGIMGPVIAPLGRVMGVPSWVFYDTETATLTNRYVYPSCHRLYLPDSYAGPAPVKAHRYPGLHELAYLHPNRFRPDPSVRAEAGLDADEPFALVRIVSWEASHDIGDTGFSDPVAFVRELQKHLRVVVSGERGVPEAIRHLAVTTAPHRIHPLLQEASLFVGEGATMAIEAGLLGTPAVFVHTAQLSVLDVLERQYGLVRTARNQAQAKEATAPLLEDLDAAAATWRERVATFLDEKIDVAAYMIREVEDAYAAGALHLVATPGPRAAAR